MKRIITGILILALAITLAGCGGAPVSVPDTTSVPAPDLAQEPTPEPESVQEPESVIEEPEPVQEPILTSSSDAKQIEAVLREYYEAFSCYDLDRVGKVIAEQSLEEEGVEIALSVAWAKSMNLKTELKSVVSIQIDGDSALVVVECESSLGLGQDTWHLVREDGNWKLASKAETP